MKTAVLLLFLVCLLILWNQAQILRKLPAQTSRTTMPTDLLRGDDWHLVGDVRHAREDSFEIGFADYWTLGRVFKIFLDVDNSENVASFEFDTVEITVFPTGEGFKNEAFGRCSVITEQYRTAVLHLPERIARSLLEELRMRPKQTLGLRGIVDDKGARLITHLELGP